MTRAQEPAGKNRNEAPFHVTMNGRTLARDNADVEKACGADNKLLWRVRSW
ncbi:MAG: hypothetical protein ACYDD2_09560 [Candidatus Acidiferrales bacterium]